MAVRTYTAVIAGLCYFVTIPFLILVLIGNTHRNPILDDIFFFKLDVSQIIPISVENSNLLNSVARSLGLHDFYQVLVGELLAGARIALPSEVVTILTLLRIGSQVMYAFFISGIVLNFVLLILTPLVLKTRWFSLCTSLIGAVAGLVLTVAAVIATVITVAAKIALTAQDQLNIQCDIGGKMFAFMWIAALLTDFAFLLHAAMGCCCAPDKRSRGLGSRVPSPSGSAMPEKNDARSMPSFIRRRKGMS
ncbi:integral membrane [Trichoderma cornu-damae]|uniref:Integral membrane n=1 Tax=Trichoderma cornu-damae TaxID=654480 RepID=A0A9P8QQX4_9HYPO|nr:integral membrane [Trichoderma cornu-damae]